MKHRAEILRMLDDGASILAIKDRLGLEDMPYNTFRYHANKLRDAARSAPPQAVQTQPPSPARSVEHDPPRSSEPAKDATQPERVKPPEPDTEKPKRAPRKRRSTFVISDDRDAKPLNLDPSKWKVTE